MDKLCVLPVQLLASEEWYLNQNLYFESIDWFSEKFV